MFDDIDALGWLVILSALALGFGAVRFMIVVSRDQGAEAPAPPEAADPPGDGPGPR